MVFKVIVECSEGEGWWFLRRRKGKVTEPSVGQRRRREGQDPPLLQIQEVEPSPFPAEGLANGQVLMQKTRWV